MAAKRRRSRRSRGSRAARRSSRGVNAASRHRHGQAQRSGYETAKNVRDALEADLKEKTAKLNAHPKNALGLTPDAYKTAEWRSDKAATDKAFRRLQQFNAQFVRAYRKEIAADRDEQRAARLRQRTQ